MDIIINTGESNASLWLSIISLIVASLSFLIPYFRPHIVSKRSYWVSLDNKFSLNDYDQMIKAIKEEKFYLHILTKFRNNFCDFTNFNTIEGFFIFKTEKIISKNKEIYSSMINDISKLTNKEKEVFTINDEEMEIIKNRLVDSSINGKNEYLKLKIFLTRFPYNL